MAYPIHPSEGFLRTPERFPHDAFGVDTGGRERPHSGFDATPTVANCPARSVLGGRVVQTGYTIYAGHYVVEAAPDGWLWLSLHLARLFVAQGHVTRPDTIIGVVGNTGGGGGSPLKGNAKMGRHIHVSRCRDMDAVNRIIHGKLRARYKGETSAQWAAAHGLSDPYPHILASVKSTEKDKDQPPAKTPEQIEEEELMGAKEEIIAALSDKVEREARLIESRVRREVRPEVYFISEGADGTRYTFETSPAAILVQPASGFLMPMNRDGGHVGQHGSLKQNYRVIGWDSAPQGFPERVFWNTLKDVARGAGIIDRNIGEAEGVAWAKSLFETS
jgi:hypothetical protein